MTTTAALTDLLYRVEQRRRALVTEVLGRHDLTLTQWVTLKALITHGACSMTQLAQASAVDRTSLTRMVDGLIARGWVLRSSIAGDRRAVIVRISPDGEAIICDAGAEVEGLERQLLSVLDDERQLALMRKLADLLQSWGPAAGADGVISRRSRSA